MKILSKKSIKFICIISLIIASFFSFILKKEPIVSVVMPVYNRSDKFLSTAIESILSQTYKNFEFIIINDGSTDNTLQFLKNCQKKDNRIRIASNNKNSGISVSRTNGNKLARGKYIVIMDSDDEAYPIMIEKLVDFMEKTPEATVAFPARNAYNDSPSDKLIAYYNQHLYDIFFDNSIQNVGNIFRKDFIEKNKIKYNMQTKAAEDYDFWAKIVMAGGKIYAVQPRDSLLLIRIHQSNSNEYYADMKRTAQETARSLLEFFDVPKEDQLNKCLVLKKIALSPKNFLTKEELNNGFQKYCPPNKQYILTKHIVWHDYILIPKDKKQICRLSSDNDCADILYWNGKKLKIKWHKWGTETFIMNKNKELVFTP